MIPNLTTEQRRENLEKAKAARQRSLLGRIHTRSYQKDGQSIKRWDVRVDDVELMQYKRDAQSTASANAAAPGLAMATGDPSPVAPAQPAAPDLYDDDIPF